MNRIERDIVEVEPYAVLAGIYDNVMDHVDYSRWVQFITEILESYDLHPPPMEGKVRILECGCGTGTVAVHLALRGYQVDGFDLSPAMIEIARRKVRTLRMPPKFTILDFRDLDTTDRYDVILCLYDSVNYLLSEDLMKLFFDKLEDSLGQDGILIFDVCTKFNSLKNFRDRIETDSGKGFRYTRHMKFDERSSIQENHFEIHLDEDPDKLFLETHRQRIYDIEDVEAILKKSDLTVEQKYGDYNFSEPAPDALRVHYVCKSKTSIEVGD